MCWSQQQIFSNGFFIILWAQFELSRANSVIIFTQLNTVIYNKDLVNFYNIRLIPYRGRNVINGSFQFSQSMSKLNVRLTFDFEKPDKTRFQLINLKADYCDILGGKENKHKLVKLIIQQLLQQDNFINECPLKGNYTYDLMLFHVRTPQFPFPNVKILVNIILYDEHDRKVTDFRLKAAAKRRS